MTVLQRPNPTTRPRPSRRAGAWPLVGALAAVLAMILVPPAFGQQTRAELKRRFEQRYERIVQWKDNGLVGETHDGYIETLHEGLLNGNQREVVTQENDDRKTLYALIAENVDEDDRDREAGRQQDRERDREAGRDRDRDRRVPPRVVAERNARRNFDNARPDHHLKVNEGRWVQKRDLDRFERIARLKRDGIVGETSDGMLDVVEPRPSDEVRGLVEQENRDRERMYREIARRLERVEPQEVARQAGRDTREHLPPGHFYKARSGGWERRPAREARER